MTPQQAAHDIAGFVLSAPARFMTAPETFARGAELGYEGMDFYIAGRGGALGDVPADVVSAALYYSAPDTIRTIWDRSASVLLRRRAAEEWLACGHRWAREYWADGPDYARALELARASAEYRELGSGPTLRHRARFYSGDALRLRTLFEIVGRLDACDVLIDDRPLPYARELWLPLMWFLIS